MNKEWKVIEGKPDDIVETFNQANNWLDYVNHGKDINLILAVGHEKSEYVKYYAKMFDSIYVFMHEEDPDRYRESRETDPKCINVGLESITDDVKSRYEQLFKDFNIIMDNIIKYEPKILDKKRKRFHVITGYSGLENVFFNIARDGYWDVLSDYPQGYPCILTLKNKVELRFQLSWDEDI